MNWLKKNGKYVRLVCLVAISCYAYYNIAYTIDQSDFYLLLINYSLAFIGFASLYTKFKSNIKLLLFLSLLFRLTFFFSIPSLSQDVYRFIWDGHLIINGVNPYLSSPAELMQKNAAPFGIANELFPKLTDLSATNHSNYPPVSQLFYALSALVSPANLFGSILFLKTVLIFSDLLIYFIAKPILGFFKLPVYSVFIYLLNPLLIIEGIGNLHFESLMVLFVMAGIYFWLLNKYSFTGLMIGLGIATKLLPLLLLPFFAKGTKKYDFKAFFSKPYLVLIIIALSVSFLSFLPFLSDQTAVDYINTIGLWFNNFEFNASIYYIFRWLGYQISGWNMIAFFGKGLGVLSLLLVSLVAFRSTTSRNMQIYAMMMALLIYLFLATTIHPWYLILPLSLSIFIKSNNLILIWSFTIVFSYYAYHQAEFKENTYWLLAEYLPMIIYLIYDTMIKPVKIKV
ncbi:MAG: mannosyltransferase [Psychroflexus sp.]|nr:mannosyltransferase [Psychroflexus sp.]